MTLFLRRYPILKKIAYIICGLLIFGLIALIILFNIFRQKNQAVKQPIPIQTHSTDRVDIAEPPSAPTPVNAQLLHVVAHQDLQAPLQPIIKRFNKRYPNVNLIIDYMEASDMVAYIADHADVSLVLADSPTLSLLPVLMKPNQHDPYEQQNAVFDFATKVDNNNRLANDINSDDVNSEDTIYIDDQQRIQGLMLPNTDKKKYSLSLTFRQFLLSSETQNLLNTENFRGMDDRANQVDNLFKPYQSESPASESSLIEDKASDNSVDKDNLESEGHASAAPVDGFIIERAIDNP